VKKRVPVSINVPTKAQARKIARQALRHMASTWNPYRPDPLFQGDLPAAISLHWSFGSTERHDIACDCQPCKTARKIDAPILAAIQRSFTGDPEIIDYIACYIVGSAGHAAEMEARRK
jgi:hypothetical protein